MNSIYKYGYDTSYKLLDFYIDGSIFNNSNIYDGYPPNMKPNTLIEYYPKNHDLLYDDCYIYNKIIHHIADVLFNSSKNYNLNYPLLRASGNSIIDDWCLHRFMRYKLTYETDNYINPVFLDILNSNSLIEMEKYYNKFSKIILNYNIKKYYKKYSNINN